MTMRTRGRIPLWIGVDRWLLFAIAALALPLSSGCQNPQWGLTPAPTFSVGSGVYSTSQWVFISNNAEGASLHYTTDGGEPTLASPCGSGPISIAGEAVTKTIQAVAIGGKWGGKSMVSSVRIGIAYGPLSLATSVTTLAGSGAMGSSDGVGTAASFNQPYGITTDGISLFVADNANSRIRRILLATGEVTTIFGNESSSYADGEGAVAALDQPYGITTDGIYLYIADSVNNRILKLLISTGAVATIAGNGRGALVDGAGAAASFNLPCGIATDGANLYVADTLNHCIRRIVIATSEVTTIAGVGIEGYRDGAGTTALFRYPYGVATDGANLYVADGGNHRIRRVVIATGDVTTLAGDGTSGSTDGVGTLASFNSPFGVATDGSNLYVADTANNRIRRIAISTGAVTTLAGSGSDSYADGVGTTASFSRPQCVATDGKSVYVADTSNNRIRCIR